MRYMDIDKLFKSRRMARGPSVARPTSTGYELEERDGTLRRIDLRGSSRAEAKALRKEARKRRKRELRKGRP